MSPDPRDRKRRASRASAGHTRPAPLRTGPSPHDAHDVVYFQRHVDDDPDQTQPGRAALRSWPAGVRAKAVAVLIAVATAPPNRFAGGGKWERMHGEMSDFFEVRVDGPKRHHYRLFCLLDYSNSGHDKPLLVVIDGRDKPFRTVLTEADYSAVSALGREYLARTPRSLG